jgi:signal transduction histidine kinase
MNSSTSKSLAKDRQKRGHDSSASIFREPPREAASHIPQRIALIDSQGAIVTVNHDWMELAEKAGASLQRVGPGGNYLDVCRSASRSSLDAKKALEGIQAVLKGKAPSFSMDYVCGAPVELAYFRMNVTPVLQGEACLAITHTDITDLQLAKENDLRTLQQFARRLINAQEVERQRIGREIHDDIGNRIALISLSVRQFMKRPKENTGDPVELQKVLQEVVDLASALRNLSHWLHSPTLRHLGIGAALKALRESFEKTYGIRINLVIPPSLPRLSDEVELCVFRVTQECLQNVAKHSGAGEAKIVIEHTASQIRLIVTDAGKGFNRAKAVREGGLGLLSMEERAQSLRGQLTIRSAPGSGTEVSLAIPMRQNPAGSTAL